MIKQSNKHTANVFLPGCLGPARREVVLEDDHDEEVAALQSLNAELLEALESTLAQCLAWQGEPDEEWSCAIHVAVCKRARAAIAKARSQA